ncbi:hypothetical protein ACOJTA_10770 [Malaciobacter sp. WC5094]
MSLKKRAFIYDLNKLIKKQIGKSLDIYLCIGSGYFEDELKKYILNYDTIDFEINFYEEIFKNLDLNYHKIHLFFRNVLFEKTASFKNLTLEKLEFREVVFRKNVGIKQVCINNLIFRPYEINANVVINVDNYSDKNGLIVDSENYFIKNIEFEDPHVCNGKIFFVGTNFEDGNFRNRLLDNVVFQNCNFENTYFANSFLSKTTFLNCKFPLIKNPFNSFFLGHSINRILFILGFTITSLVAGMVFANFNNLDFLVILIFFIPSFMIIFILFFLFSVFSEMKLSEIILKISPSKRTLINHHIGLADERLINNFDISTNTSFGFFKNRKEYSMNQKKYYDSLSNINFIYNDLKVNFKNSSNTQLSGDFHYSYSYNKIILSDRFYDTFMLIASYMINGFGERFIKSICFILFFIGVLFLISNPNEDYISTPSTPAFLLEVNIKEIEKMRNTGIKDRRIELPLNYTEDSFLLMSKNSKNFTEGHNFYAYDNRFDFNFTEHKVPKLNVHENKDLVKLYYALSHITYPFTQESKSWFQNITKKANMTTLTCTILIWIYLIGMATAIFNRVKR